MNRGADLTSRSLREPRRPTVHSAKGGEAVDREIAQSATAYPDALLELGELKVAAADLARSDAHGSFSTRRSPCPSRPKSWRWRSRITVSHITAGGASAAISPRGSSRRD